MIVRYLLFRKWISTCFAHSQVSSVLIHGAGISRNDAISVYFNLGELCRIWPTDRPCLWIVHPGPRLRCPSQSWNASFFTADLCYCHGQTRFTRSYTQIWNVLLFEEVLIPLLSSLLHHDLSELTKKTPTRSHSSLCPKFRT